jgi:dTMP kinase
MGAIIALEGIHGAGKTTQAKLLREEFSLRGVQVEYFSSSDKPFSKKLLKIIEEFGPQNPETLFFLSLANNCALRARLREDHVSILDRYVHTDIASTYAAGKDLNWIKNVIPGAMYPSLTILIDLDPEEALKRKGGNSTSIERGELQKGNSINDFIDYQNSLRRAYLEISHNDDNFQILDGRKPREEIHNEILASIRKIKGLI